MRTLVTLLGAFLLAAVPAGSASARDLFKSGVAGKEVANQVIAGISPDVAAPWVVEEGEAKITTKGRSGNTKLEVDVEGLLLLDGTVGPVRSVIASLVCQKTAASADPTNEVVADTADVPLSAAGDAEIEEAIELPPVCVAPIVLIRIKLVDFGGGPFPITDLGVPEPWIAASGF